MPPYKLIVKIPLQIVYFQINVKKRELLLIGIYFLHLF